MINCHSAPAPRQQPPPSFQFRLIHVFYAMVILSVALATFGGLGISLGVTVLLFWGWTFYYRPRLCVLVIGSLVIVTCSYLITLLLPSIYNLQEAAYRSSCAGNLKAIATALHHYHDVYGEFPPAFIADQNGKPMHSWRVLILPFLEMQDVYHEYSFHEPWDGPNNRKLLTPPPSRYFPYQCSFDIRHGRGRGTWTSYVAVIGPRTAWLGSKSREFSDFGDGASKTILLLEDQSQEIAWMEPRDLTYDEAIALLDSHDRQTAGIHRQKGFYFEYSGGRNVALADASLKFLPDGLSHERIADLLRVNDGQTASSTPVPSAAGAKIHLTVGNWLRLALFCVLVFIPMAWGRRRARTNEAVDSPVCLPAADADEVGS